MVNNNVNCVHLYIYIYIYIRKHSEVHRKKHTTHVICININDTKEKSTKVNHVNSMW